jgi:hypothetical protein
MSAWENSRTHVPYLGRLVCDVRSGINRGGAPQAPSYTLGAFFTSLRNPLTRLNSGGGRRSQVMKKQRPLTNWANLPHQQPMNCWSSGATGQPPQPTWAFFDQAAGFRIRRPVAPSRMCLHLQLFRHLASRLPPLDCRSPQGVSRRIPSIGHLSWAIFYHAAHCVLRELSHAFSCGRFCGIHHFTRPHFT